jgi:hypothetical protein
LFFWFATYPPHNLGHSYAYDVGTTAGGAGGMRPGGMAVNRTLAERPAMRCRGDSGGVDDGGAGGLDGSARMGGPPVGDGGGGGGRISGAAAEYAGE